MKKLQVSKKLELNKVTITRLDNILLKVIKGGTGYSCYDTICGAYNCDFTEPHTDCDDTGDPE